MQSERLGRRSSNNLAILSFNIEGIRGNIPYLRDLCTNSNFDIICLQEIWLWDYEKHTTKSLLPEYTCFPRAVDTDFPKTHFVRSRGYGGVLIAWKEKFETYITRLNDGNNRIIAIEIETADQPICLINCYMPTFGYKTTSEEYQECLDILDAIILKYKSTHQIVICGDMNATLMTSRNNDSDKRLRKFIESNSLSTDIDNKDKPTYIHGNGKSQIDYCFTLNATVSPTIISDPHCINSSSHVPIMFNVIAKVSSIKHQKQKVTATRLLWDKADIQAYQENIYINMISIQSPDQIVDFVNSIHKSVLHAAKTAIPAKRIKFHGPKWKASPETLSVIMEGKRLHKAWLELGKPGVDHPISIERKNIKKIIRSTQRKQVYEERTQFYNQLNDTNNTVGFYKLVKRARQDSSTVQSAMKRNGDIILDFSEQCNGFANFYEDLAIPSHHDSFDKSYLDRVNSDMKLIREIVQNHDIVNVISEEEIVNAIFRLNTNKAPDEFGISAEHIKHADMSLIPALSTLFNAIIKHSYIPEQFKTGVINPVLKKGKDPTKFDSYRGITITSIIGKLLELVILERIKTNFPESQSSLQFGFSCGLSPSMAALIISEAVVEATENGQSLYLALLDSQRAFDVVSHQSMKRKLFLSGINLKLWKLIDNWYQNLTSKVKWKGIQSRPFPILQGVRQGGILSTGLYKTYINDLLLSLEEQQLGSFIGTTYIGCPTVADDVALISYSPDELQNMLNVTFNYSTRECYNIHPQKSMVIPKVKSKRSEENLNWSLGHNDILITNNGVHLGIIRAVKNELTINVDERISCARKSLYSLIGTGVHGTNGLLPSQCLSMYNTYVLPRLLYGLEIFILRQKDLSLLEHFHINFLRSIQAIPTRTSKSITHLLVGCRTITAELHLRQLSLLGCIIRSQNSTLLSLLYRQSVMKSEDSKSWFVHITDILEQYDLPKIEELRKSTLSKQQWKKQTKNAVDSYWTKSMVDDCYSKSTLEYCNFQTLKIGTLHPVWLDIPMNQKDIKRSSIKCRMITGTYILQSTSHKFNSKEVDPTCPLCITENEDIVHFLTTCNALHQYRSKYITELKNLFDGSLQKSWELLKNDRILLARLILDASVLIEPNIIPDCRVLRKNIESITRKLCFSLHCGRTFLINSVTG